MVKNARKAELEGLSPLYLEAKCQEAGLDASGSKAQMIGRLLKSEGQVSKPIEPIEPPEEPVEPVEPIEPIEPPEEPPSED